MGVLTYIYCVILLHDIQQDIKKFTMQSCGDKKVIDIYIYIYNIYIYYKIYVYLYSCLEEGTDHSYNWGQDTGYIFYTLNILLL